MDMARYFPLFFIALWLFVTTLLAVLTGWFSLMTRYPDRPETPLLKLRWQSGRMGMGVHMNGALTISACPSGLRVGMLRVFGVFCRDFFVPWEEVFVDRTQSSWLMGPQARLTFGSTGTLTVLATVADQLALAASTRWPEAAPPQAETRRDVFRRFVRLWLISTAFAATFFAVVPRLVAPEADFPPIATAILFPAMVFGVGFLTQYRNQTRHLPKD
ncbi:MAG TPA: hypothetical protein VH722_10720 [Alphaproteobacteria bacterium]|jgi:hypothetical protein|nr:hypothetical protein [Alphaproteobacteria bacterium]